MDGTGEHPETKEVYTYGVDPKGNRDGSCQIVLVDNATTKVQLKKHMDDLVTFMVSEGNTEEDAVTQIIKDINHARNISQRAPLRPSASKRNGCKGSCQGQQGRCGGGSFQGSHIGGDQCVGRRGQKGAGPTEKEILAV